MADFTVQTELYGKIRVPNSLIVPYLDINIIGYGNYDFYKIHAQNLANIADAISELKEKVVNDKYKEILIENEARINILMDFIFGTSTTDSVKQQYSKFQEDINSLNIKISNNTSQIKELQALIEILMRDYRTIQESYESLEHQVHENSNLLKQSNITIDYISELIDSLSKKNKNLIDIINSNTEKINNELQYIYDQKAVLLEAIIIAKRVKNDLDELIALINENDEHQKDNILEIQDQFRRLLLHSASIDNLTSVLNSISNEIQTLDNNITVLINDVNVQEGIKQSILNNIVDNQVFVSEQNPEDISDEIDAMNEEINTLNQVLNDIEVTPDVNSVYCEILCSVLTIDFVKDYSGETVTRVHDTAIEGDPNKDSLDFAIFRPKVINGVKAWFDVQVLPDSTVNAEDFEYIRFTNILGVDTYLTELEDKEKFFNSRTTIMIEDDAVGTIIQFKVNEDSEVEPEEEILNLKISNPINCIIHTRNDKDKASASIIGPASPTLKLALQDQVEFNEGEIITFFIEPTMTMNEDVSFTFSFDTTSNLNLATADDFDKIEIISPDGTITQANYNSSYNLIIPAGSLQYQIKCYIKRDNVLDEPVEYVIGKVNNLSDNIICYGPNPVEMKVNAQIKGNQPSTMHLTLLTTPENPAEPAFEGYNEEVHYYFQLDALANDKTQIRVRFDTIEHTEIEYIKYYNNQNQVTINQEDVADFLQTQTITVVIPPAEERSAAIIIAYLTDSDHSSNEPIDNISLNIASVSNDNPDITIINDCVTYIGLSGN